MRYRTRATPAKVLGVVGAAALVLAACGDDGDDATSVDSGEEELPLITSGTLSVCTDAPFEPFEFQEDDGTWTGFDMELVREIANRLDLGMEAFEQPFEGIWLAPAAGTCDIVASAMTITDERAENALFSDGYFEADQSLLVPVDSADEIQTLDDLEGLTVGAQSDTTGLDYALENVPEGASVKEFNDEAEIFAALDAGVVQAVVQDLPVNGFRAQESDDYEVAEIYETGEVYGFATTPDNTALIDAVNAVLSDLQAEGFVDDLVDEWIPAEWYGEGADDGDDSDDNRDDADDNSDDGGSDDDSDDNGDDDSDDDGSDDDSGDGDDDSDDNGDGAQ